MNLPEALNRQSTPWTYAYSPQFRDAPVRCVNEDRDLIFAVDGRVFSKDMYHRLPEYRDWHGLMRGDLAILGRIELDADFLDLVVMDTDDGYLRSTLIHRDTAQTLPREVRAFIDRLWQRAPIIHIYETLNNRSTK